jgi:hypothetical protein
MNPSWTRRRLLLTGTTALIAGCSLRNQSSTDARSGGIWYEVADGDTLTALHRRTGLSVQAIIDANDLTSARLAPRTRLWLPGVSAVSGDPLARLEEPQPEVVPAPTREETEPEPKDIPEPPPGNGYVLVPRSAWTRTPPAGNIRPMGQVTRLTLHHTDEHPGLEGLPDIEVIRRIENYHRNGKKWCAIGYHYLVGKDGRIYEGRPARYQGAHVLSENENNLGISVMGDFQSHLPNARQLAALRSFLDDMRDKYRVGKPRLYGHRDLNKSICPGDALYAWLRTKYKA